jgi:hypothetical protein
VQIIFQFAGDPESYIAGDCQTKVAPPKRCPHCGRKKCMQALGYYYRGSSYWISRKGRKARQDRKIGKGLDRKHVTLMASAVLFISFFLCVHCVLCVSLIFRF